MIVENISWEEMFSIWSNKLWPNRKSAIEPVSSMCYMGGYEMFNKQQVPVFLAVRKDNKIVGVNSVVGCTDNSSRSRGLWVDENYRGQGISTLLLNSTIQHAKNSKSNFIWTVPRMSAFPAYTKAGFIRTSDWFEQGMEFGPNCYAQLNLK